MKVSLPKSLRAAGRAVRAKMLSVGLQVSQQFELSEQERIASRSVSIIVPVHDSPDVSRRCLQSLARWCGEAQVVIVDDGSQPATREMLEQFCREHHWSLVRHERAKGHSRSCESGVVASDRPIICLLNSDTVVTPWSWSAAVEAFDADSKIGATGPSTSWAATRQRIDRAMHCRHYWSDGQICAFARKYVTSQPQRSWVDLEELSGFALFIRRSAWDGVGGFNPRLDDYGNESELCIRLRATGWRLIWTQNSYIHHFGQQSYGALGRDIVRERRVRARAYINELHPAKA